MMELGKMYGFQHTSIVTTHDCHAAYGVSYLKYDDDDPYKKHLTNSLPFYHLPM